MKQREYTFTGIVSIVKLFEMNTSWEEVQVRCAIALFFTRVTEVGILVTCG